MRVKILEAAEKDLEEGFRFYEEIQKGFGEYFINSLFSDIDSLAFFAGIHPVVYSHYRLLSKRFPFAVYYLVVEGIVYVTAVLDCRRKPSWIKDRLTNID